MCLSQINKNASRFREASCVSRVPDFSVTSLQAQIPHGRPGGSHSHGHAEVNRVHIGQNSMPLQGLSQEAVAGKCFEKFHRPIKRGGMAYILNEKMVFYDLITIKKGCISWDIEDWDVLEYLFLRYAWGQ